MPVEQTNQRQLFKAVGLGLAAVAASVGFIAFVLIVTDRGAVEINLGDDVFDAGKIEIVAKNIDEGGPLTYADVSGGNSHIVINHLGEDPETGWYAFDLVLPGNSEDCQLRWQPTEDVFRDSCDESVVVTQTGDDQPSYPVSIEDGRLLVELRPSP